jgi:ketosteroid isomerase-like protein
MTEWASVLPGFDRTRHAISNIQVHVNDDSANATADVVADHYLGNHYWQVKGDYSYTLKKEGADWKITMHRFNLRGETGSRDILKMALEAAAVHPVSYIKRQQTQNAVRDFLTALEEKDMAKFAAVWADDAVQEMPYSPGNFPKRIVGKENLIKHYSAWPANSGHATFTKELVFYQMMDPESVFVEYHGLVDIIPTGRVYDQRYAGLFHVENGKITLFREYYNPIAFSYAFGLNEGRQFDSKQKQ